MFAIKDITKSLSFFEKKRFLKFANFDKKKSTFPFFIMSNLNLQDLLNLEEDEEDGDFEYGEPEKDDDEEMDADEEKDDETNLETNEGQSLIPTDYDFDVNVDPTKVDEEGIFVSQDFSTNRFKFYVGFYPKKDGLLPFVFSHDIEKRACIDVDLKINETVYSIKDEEMNKEFPMIRQNECIGCEIKEPTTMHVHLHYIPNQNESRKYFGCVGLKNDGMTCYLNSLIQSLFHIRGFRKLVFNMNTKESEIPMALANLFCKMQTSSKPASTRRLTKSFGWQTEDLFEQQDVQELMRILLDRLDNCSNNEASKMFKGVFNSYIRVPTKDYESSHTEPFYDISLSVKGIENIQDSIKQFFEPDRMEGDDQYEMEDKTKVDALKGFETLEDPPILCLHLRRFEYANGTMHKINSRFEFTKELDFGKSKYRLCSIIAHIGSVFGGHYCAFVFRDGRWLCFDDDSVYEIPENDAIDGNFGGEKHGFTAYVLFYSKIEVIDELIDCPEPEINENIIADIENHQKNREVSYTTDAEECQEGKYNKTQIPREGSLDEIKAVFAEVTGIDKDSVVLRTINSKDEIGGIVTDEDVQSLYKFFVSNTSDIPITAQFYVPGYELYTFKDFFVKDGSVITQVYQAICEKCNIECVPLVSYIFSSNGTLMETIGDEEITKYERIIFQVQIPNDNEEEAKRAEEASQKAAEHLEMKLFEAKENTPIDILGDEIDTKTADKFIELTENIIDVTFKHIITNENPIKLSLPHSLSYDNVIKCLAKKLEKEENAVMIFRLESIRKILKITHSTLSQMLENREYDEYDDELLYAVAPGPQTLYERSDITVMDEEGSLVERFELFLERGKQSLNDLRAAIAEKVGEPFHLYYSHGGIPSEPQGEERAEFNYKCIVQKGEGPKENEVAVKVIHIWSTNQLYDDENDGFVPYFINVDKEKPVSEIMNEISEKTKQETVLVKGTSRRIDVVDNNNFKAADISEMFIARVTVVDLSCFLGSSTPLHMNK